MSYVITGFVLFLAGVACGALIWRKNGVRFQTELDYWKARAGEVKKAVKGE